MTKLLMPNRNLTSSDQETANTLKESFSSVFKNENETYIPNFEDRNFNEILDEISITEKKVEDAIDILSPSKSQGPDKFHPYYLKETKDHLKKPVCIIFKKSVQEKKSQKFGKWPMWQLFLRRVTKSFRKIIDP